MAEKKIQENPLPEEQPEATPADKPKDTIPDKPTTLPIPVLVPEPAVTRPVPSFTKNQPNDLYRRLLPAVLFVLTFVTVMTMLLIYMDTVAMGAQQFRLNMSRDYELARIPQESAALVLYVRQLHLQPRPARAPPAAPPAGPRADLLDRLLGDVSNGTFVEFLPRGPRDAATRHLEARGWDGVVVRAAPRDYLALRGAARALHACLSPTAHPREVTYHEADAHAAMFSSRVLCLPLYTVLLAAEAARAQLLLLGGGDVPPALAHLPFDKVHLQVIDYRSTDPVNRNLTTRFLETKNYTVAGAFDDGVVYALGAAPAAPAARG